MTTDNTVAKKMLSDLWWIVLLRATVLLVVGAVLLFKPGVPLTVAILVMGVYWFVDGILTITKSVRTRSTNPSWGFGVFVGAVSVLAGLVVFSQPVASGKVTASFLVFFLGAAAILSGVTSLVTGIRLRNEMSGEWYLIIGGAVSIVFGILLIASPLYSIMVLVKTLGVIALVVGLVLFGQGIQIRNTAQRLGE